ncbi:uncharacterized protein G2W53_037055 [Senna tora]|uniref:Uncharacterized protein n=1 Tax=Senna tora TaxID=362788 RepID=A0A834SV77_9FABA|nr:uncharacterized protein G2W53_037055 [Senna tora]
MDVSRAFVVWMESKICLRKVFVRSRESWLKVEALRVSWSIRKMECSFLGSFSISGHLNNSLRSPFVRTARLPQTRRLNPMMASTILRSVSKQNLASYPSNILTLVSRESCARVSSELLFFIKARDREDIMSTGSVWFWETHVPLGSLVHPPEDLFDLRVPQLESVLLEDVLRLTAIPSFCLFRLSVVNIRL